MLIKSLNVNFKFSPLNLKLYLYLSPSNLNLSIFKSLICMIIQCIEAPYSTSSHVSGYNDGWKNYILLKMEERVIFLVYDMNFLFSLWFNSSIYVVLHRFDQHKFVIETIISIMRSNLEEARKLSLHKKKCCLIYSR